MAIRYLSGINVDSNTLFVDSTNNRVGIGTGSPSSALHISRASAVFQITDTNKTANNSLWIQALSQTSWGIGTADNSSSGTKITIADSGNVGIGTTAPAAKLDVAGDIRLGGTATYNSVSVYNNSASGGGGYLAYQNGVANAYFGAAGWYIGNSDTGAVIGTDSSSRPIRFYTNTERMRITGGGNVGIGTTNPAGKLSIEGDGTEYSNIVFKQSAAQEHLIYASTSFQYNLIGSGGPTWIWGQQGGSEIMRLNNTGLGIGTDSPSTKLHTVGNIRSANAGNTVYSELQNDGVYAVGTDLYLLAPASKFVSIYAGNAERMRIASTGATRLNAYGSGSITGTATYGLAVDSSGNIIEVTSTLDGSGTTNYVTKWADSNTLTDSVIYDNGTSVGVGTTTPNPFSWATKTITVVSSASNSYAALEAYGNGTGAGALLLGNTSILRASIVAENGSNLLFATNAGNTGTSQTERMRITAAGNVGIGTTSPSYPLHVANSGIYHITAEQTKTNTADTDAYATFYVINNAGTSQVRGFLGAGGASVGNTAMRNHVYIGAQTNHGLRLFTNDSARVTVDTSGNVGIGTTAPAHRLDVQANTTSEPYVQARFLNTNSSTTQYGGILVSGTNQAHIRFLTGTSTWDGAGAKQWQIRTGFGSNTDALSIYSWTAGAEVIYFNSSGNVGIGNTAPTAGYKLDVVGSILSRVASGNTSVVVQTNNANGAINAMAGSGLEIATDGTNQNIAFRTGASTRMYIKSDGNVGIGTTSPTSLLHLSSNNSTYEANGILSVSGGVNAVFNSTERFIFNIDSDNTQTDRTFDIAANRTGSSGGTLLFRVQENGNVGIGTTSPSEKLTVNGNINFPFSTTGSATVGIQESTTNPFATSAKELIIQGANAFTGASPSQAQAGGNVYIKGGYAVANTGIGVYAGNVSIEGGETNSGGTSGAGKIFLKTAGQDRVIVDNAGNVGIGTTAPLAKIHVEGGGGNGTAWFGGTAIASHFNFSTDEHTYIRGGKLTSSVYIADSNTGNVFIANGGGNVGIGTTSPDAKLDVVGVIRYGNDGASVGALSYGSSGVVTLEASSANTHVSIIPSGTGNVGINTLSPSYKLAINGSAGIEASEEYLYFNSSYVVGSNARAKIRAVGAGGGSGYGGDLRISTRAQNNVWNEDAVTVNSSGNVGIGTTSPAYTLDVSGTARTTTGTYLGTSSGNVIVGGTTSDLIGGFKFIAIGNTAIQYAASTGTYLRIEPGAADTQVALKADARSGAYPPMAFHTSDTERMRVTAAGNVGIGTTSPAYKLEVNGSFGTVTSGIYLEYNSGILYHAGGSGNYYQYISGANYLLSNRTATGALVFSTVDTERMRITSAGNVGIGTTNPTKKLHVASSSNEGIFMEGTSNGGHWFDFKSANSNLWSMGAQPGLMGWYNRTDSTYKMVITDGGNVGIGTTSPGAKLDIIGNAYIGSTANNNGGAYYNLRLDALDTSSIGFHDSGSTIGAITFSAAQGGFILGANHASYGPHRVRAASDFIVDGNVGIGTTAPTVPLHIVKDNATINMTNTSAFAVDTGSRLFLGGKYSSATSNNTTPFAWIVGAKENATDGNQAGYLSITTVENGGGFAERMRVTSTGNVGIGTTSPATNLHVYSTEQKDTIGHIQYENANTGTGAATNAQLIGKSKYGTLQYMVWEANGARIGMRSTANSGSGNLYFTVGTDSVSTTMLANGNVGIGTTAPVARLHVTSSTNNVEVLRVDNTAGNSGSVQGITHLGLNFFGVGNNSGARITSYQEGASGYRGGMYFSTRGVNSDSAPTEAMRITPDQLIGLGPVSSFSTSHRVWIDRGSSTYAVYSQGSIQVNAGAIGVGVTPSATTGRIDAGNDIVAYSTSDQRLKENITPIANALDKVKSLTGVEFDWKEETKSVHGYEGHDVGVIAQEVQAVLPEAVRTNDSGYLSVRYEKMIALLVEANKELASRVEELEKKLK